MSFHEGQIIVHPHHGPALVRSIRTRGINEIRYLVLEIRSSKLIDWVPLEKADSIGLRPVMSREELEKVFDVLRAPADAEQPQWSKRFKENTELLSTGDLMDTARVVRNLTLRERNKGLSRAEQDMLREARKPLLTELTVSLGISEEAAAVMVEDLA